MCYRYCGDYSDFWLYYYHLRKKKMLKEYVESIRRREEIIAKGEELLPLNRSRPKKEKGILKILTDELNLRKWKHDHTCRSLGIKSEDLEMFKQKERKLVLEKIIIMKKAAGFLFHNEGQRENVLMLGPKSLLSFEKRTKLGKTSEIPRKLLNANIKSPFRASKYKKPKSIKWTGTVLEKIDEKEEENEYEYEENNNEIDLKDSPEQKKVDEPKITVCSSAYQSCDVEETDSSQSIPQKSQQKYNEEEEDKAKKRIHLQKKNMDKGNPTLGKGAREFKIYSEKKEKTGLESEKIFNSKDNIQYLLYKKAKAEEFNSKCNNNKATTTKESHSETPSQHPDFYCWCLMINKTVYECRPSIQHHGPPRKYKICQPSQIKLNYIFEALPGETLSKFIFFNNVCRLPIKYTWRRKLPNEIECYKSSPTTAIEWLYAKGVIENIRSEKQLPSVFFFNKSSGVIGPLKSFKLPIMFHSKFDGYFYEKWLLRTDPPLNGSNSFGEIEFRLSGVVVCPLKKEYLHPIEGTFESLKNYSFSRSLILDIINKITRHEVVLSGKTYDSFLLSDELKDIADSRNLHNEVEIFYCSNPPQYYYHSSIIANLKCIYREVTRINGAERHWNLSISKLKKEIFHLEDKVVKSKYLDIFCTNIDVLFEPGTEEIKDERKHLITYTLLCKLTEKIPLESRILKESLMNYELTRSTSDVQTEQTPLSEPVNNYMEPIPYAPSDVQSPSFDMTDGERLLMLYRQSLYVRVYNHLLKTVDQLVICIEASKNKQLISNVQEILLLTHLKSQ